MSNVPRSAMDRHSLMEAPADDAAFLDAVERGLIHPKAFDHRAHVRLAYLTLRTRAGDRDAGARALRARIQSFNRGALDAGFDLPVGYHETVTTFWTRVVRHAMRALPVDADSHEFCSANPDLLRRQRILDHYSRERVMSEDAFARFIEPDLKPMPDASDRG